MVVCQTHATVTPFCCGCASSTSCTSSASAQCVTACTLSRAYTALSVILSRAESLSWQSFQGSLSASQPRSSPPWVVDHGLPPSCFSTDIVLSGLSSTTVVRPRTGCASVNPLATRAAAMVIPANVFLHRLVRYHGLPSTQHCNNGLLSDWCHHGSSVVGVLSLASRVSPAHTAVANMRTWARHFATVDVLPCRRATMDVSQLSSSQDVTPFPLPRIAVLMTLCSSLAFGLHT